MYNFGSGNSLGPRNNHTRCIFVVSDDAIKFTFSTDTVLLVKRISGFTRF